MNAMLYELWDTENSSCLGAYPDEAAALADIREGVRRDGYESWSDLSLFRARTGEREASLIAEGATLLHRAEEAREIITIQGIPFDAQRLANAAATLRMLDAIKEIDFEAIMRDARAALTAIAGAVEDIQGSLDAVRTITDLLTQTSGVAVRLDTDGQRIALITSDERMAGFLATQISRTPGLVRMGVIENVYRIEIALADSERPERIAS
jgi:hypothetical protein